MTSPLPPLVTSLDVKRLSSLLLTRVGVAYLAEARRLREELYRATVIASDAAPPDLVTMNSTIVYEEEGEPPKEITVVYPWRSRERGVVSVLSALGTALLGRRVGAETPLGDAWNRRVRVLSLRYQPEAAGHWHL